MSKAQYSNRLSIAQSGKCIPYGHSAEPRADGSMNYGFLNLKAEPELALEVPELLIDSELMRLVCLVNDPESMFFTVGCTSGDVADALGYRRAGYIEFVLNSREHVAKASTYFPLFFEFDRFLATRELRWQVAYDWELMGASFLDAGIEGFTCAVFVNTHYLPTRTEAQESWAKSIEYLSSFLSKYRGMQLDYIYTSGV